MLSFLGSLLGFGASFLPKILNYFEDRRDLRHEIALFKLQMQLQERIGELRIREINIDADIRESEALHKSHTSITRKASQWVVNMSSTVRPVITYCFFLEIAVLTGLVSFDYMTQEEFRLIWNDELQAVWAAVISFWFGQRSFQR